MKKNFFKKLILLIMCMTLVSTQIFAEEILYLINARDSHDNHDLNYISDDNHDHENGFRFLKNDEDNKTFKQ